MYTARPNERARKPRPKRRTRKPFAPAIRCVIKNVETGERIGYDKELKSIAYFTVNTIFSSHNKAKNALWHICQYLPPKARKGEADRYVIIKSPSAGPGPS